VQSPVEAPATEEEVTSDDAEPEAVEVPSVPDKKPVAQPQPVKKGKHQFGKMDVQAMMEKIKEEEKAQDTSESAEPLTLEKVKEAWETYIAQCDQESVKVIMRNAELSLKSEEELHVEVSSNLAENTIRQEDGLMDFLREKLTAPKLLMSLHVDKTKGPEPPPKPKRLMSSKEKYLEMRETNPLLQEMQKRFDLRPDE